METPILLGANPEVSNPVEWIPVRFDKWNIRVEGLVDSSLVLCERETKEKITLSTVNGAIYKGPCEVRVEFRNRGTERTITVFAVECK